MFTSQVPRLHPSAVAVRQCHLEKLGISQAIPHDVYLTRTVIKCGSSPKRVCGSLWSHSLYWKCERNPWVGRPRTFHAWVFSPGFFSFHKTPESVLISNATTASWISHLNTSISPKRLTTPLKFKKWGAGKGKSCWKLSFFWFHDHLWWCIVKCFPCPKLPYVPPEESSLPFAAAFKRRPASTFEDATVREFFWLSIQEVLRSQTRSSRVRQPQPGLQFLWAAKNKDSFVEKHPGTSNPASFKMCVSRREDISCLNRFSNYWVALLKEIAIRRAPHCPLCADEGLESRGQGILSRSKKKL